MKENHPTQDIKETLSNRLAGKTIVMALCGSVGVVKAPELARLLIRHGARVIPVMSEAARKLIHPDLIHWATGEKVILELNGEVDHVKYCGNCQTKADLFLVYPATANSLSKIACGIDDTVVTTFATTAIGERIPTIIVPAMHLPMYHHPAIQKNIDQLKSYGITVVEPLIEEGKAKIAAIEDLLELVCQKITKKNTCSSPATKELQGKRIIITGGRTIESIDPFRIITNRSSGKMASALATEAIKRGAEVILITGAHNTLYPSEAKIIEVESTQEMAKEIKKALKAPTDWLFSAAAVADWKAKTISSQKISTDHPKLQLTLVPTVKIIDQVKKWNPDCKLVAFRALNSAEENQMIANATNRMQKADADFICLNAIDRKGEGFGSNFNSFFLISKEGTIEKVEHQSKESCAKAIFNFILAKK